jgi:hypothetical protein
MDRIENLTLAAHHLGCGDLVRGLEGELSQISSRSSGEI